MGFCVSAMVFDFESNSISIHVLIRVTDHLGGNLDQNLTIEIVDAFVPIVETRGVRLMSNGTDSILSGKLLDKGSSLSGILEKGFVSTNPNPMIDTKQIKRYPGFLD